VRDLHSAEAGRCWSSETQPHEITDRL
jgi:hypothetical protein